MNGIKGVSTNGTCLAIPTDRNLINLIDCDVLFAYDLFAYFIIPLVV